MDFYPVAIEKLIEEFAKLPGIGKKTAQRLTLYVLNLPKDEVEEFSNALVKARGTIKYCSVCGNFTDSDPCAICGNPSRDKTQICVVEQPQDIRLRELVSRMNGNIKEVIVATNPNIEGEATAMYISKILKPLDVKVTRIAAGIPVGGDLEYADEVTLSKALEGRKEI